MKMFFPLNKMNIYYIIIIALLVYIVYRLEKRNTGACPCSTYLNDERQYFDPQSNLPQKNSPFARGSFYKGVPYYTRDQLQVDNVYSRESPELPRNMNLTYSTYGFPYVPNELPANRAVYYNGY